MDAARTLSRLGVGAAVLAGMAPATQAYAQPTLDRVLSGATVVENDRCAVVQVDFNFPIRYISHFPTGRGDDLRIRVRAVDGGHDGSMLHRESVRPPRSRIAQIAAIDFEGDRPEGPTLDVVFAGTTAYHVGQGPDFRSIRIALPTDPSDARCTPEAFLRREVATPSAEVQIPVQQVPPPAPAPDLSIGAANPQLAEVRAAITAGDTGRAVQLLTRLLSGPQVPALQDAQELLGVVRERNGQRAQARAEYEEYLRRYPSGPGADRVRQRLAALLAVDTAPRPQLRPTERAETRGGAEWGANASLSQFYFRDENVRTFEDAFSAPTSASVTEKETTQNELLTAFDADVAVATHAMHARIRTSAAYVNDFRDADESEGSISAAYLEVGDAEDHVVGRVGRQTRSTGGVFGRFDGGLLSLSPWQGVRFDIAAGYPVDTPRDLTFDPHRYFYGLAADLQVDKWDISVYGLQQKTFGLIDREAVGFETRYVSDKATAFALFDYDLHYKQINIGLLNGTLNLLGETSLNFSFDHRKAPMLTTTNAVIGQMVGALDELAATYTTKEIEQLAEDRTAESTAYMLGLAHPFNEKFSVNFDATVANLSSTPASGGVPANEGTGADLYTSVQLIGTSLFKEGDLGIIGVRYVDTAASKRYGIDLNTRYPITRAVRINPRVRVAYRDNKNGSGSLLSARPSMRLNIYPSRRFSFEIDGGAEWQRTDTPLMKDESWDYYVNVGYRLDF